MSGLTKSAAQGARWTATSSVAVAIVQFVQMFVMARLLAPADFGLMAMTAVVLGFVQIYGDVGVSNAIVYRLDATADQLSSLYWLNIFAGTAVFIAVQLAIPLIVLLYGEPRLLPLLRWMALTLLIAPIGQQFQFLLQRELRFDRLAGIEFGVALSAAAVSIAGALAGRGVFSLVLGQLVSATLLAASLFFLSWRTWRPSLHFAFADLRGYLSFGLFQLGERTVNFLASRADQFLIGIFLGPISLGYYVLAWNLVIQPVAKINPILTRVSFPLFARVQAQSDRLQRGYLTLVWLLTTVNAPILIGCAAIAPAFIPALFGAKWVAAVPIVQILSLAALVRAIGNPVGSLLLATGRANVGFYWNLGLLCAQVPGVLLGALLGGMRGVAISVLLLHLCYFAANYFFVVRIVLGPTLRAYSRSLLPALGIATVMAGAVSCLSYLNFPQGNALLVVQILGGAAVYAALTVWFERDRLRELKLLVFG